jgi:hypothetical protein
MESKLPRFLVEAKPTPEADRQPTTDFPPLKDHQILELAKGNRLYAQWAKQAAETLGLVMPEAEGIDLGEHQEELLITPYGFELDSRRPTEDFPELDGDQILAMANGNGVHAAWAQWAAEQYHL